MNYGVDNPLRVAYSALRKAGELVIPHGKMRSGFWVGSDWFVSRGTGTSGRHVVFVDWWEGKTKASAERLAKKIRRAGVKAYTGSRYAL